jgi:hypothetical protein
MHAMSSVKSLANSRTEAAARSFGTLDSKLFCFLAGIEEKKCLTAICFYIYGQYCFQTMGYALFRFIYGTNITRFTLNVLRTSTAYTWHLCIYQKNIFIQARRKWQIISQLWQNCYWLESCLAKKKVKCTQKLLFNKNIELALICEYNILNLLFLFKFDFVIYNWIICLSFDWYLV